MAEPPETAIVHGTFAAAGEAVLVKAENFASEVLLNRSGRRRAHWARRHPMAVLVSADGRIAFGVVGGGPAVLELLGAGVLAAA